jgi:putative hydrolase of the HAD superfamily
MHSPAPPRFLFFDLGNVLIRFDHEIALSRLALQTGCDRQLVYDSLFSTGLGNRYERGLVSTAEFCATLRQALNSNLGDQEICLSISDIFQANASIMPLVNELRSGGIPIGILSNTCEAHWDFIENRFPIVGLFPVRLLSFQWQMAKPDPEIFQKAAVLAATNPNEIFFTDDLPLNVEAARAAGLDAVLFTDVRQLKADLRARGMAMTG